MSGLKVGIVCAGSMAKKMAGVLAKVEGISITAIASLDYTRATRIASKYNIENVYDSYEGLCECPDVELVYIAAVNSIHSELIRMYLKAGKHVLCEKPLTLSYEDAEELFGIAKSVNRFLGEAMWITFLPQILDLKVAISNKKFGEITRVNMTVGFDMRKKDRLLKKELGGGALFDIGIYLIALYNMLFDDEYTDLKTLVVETESGVDERSIAIFKMNSGILLSIECDLSQRLDNRVVMYGDKGRAEITDLLVRNDVTYFVNNEIEKVDTGLMQNPYSYEWQAVIQQLTYDKEIFDNNKTLKSLKTVEDMRRAWNNQMK